MLEFRILGSFEVVEHERPLALGGPKRRAVLAVLLLRRGEVVSSDRLIDLLWAERPPASATKTLQGYVSHLRKAVGAETLVTRGGGYLLHVDDIDAERFEQLVAQARELPPRQARERLEQALALWRGEPLSDFAYEPWAQAEIARLGEARLAALEDRIQADLELGHCRRLVGELESLTAQHPNRERLLGQLMLALYGAGRQADALEAYRKGRRALHDELGLEPGPDLRALERRILDHDPALAPPRAQQRVGARTTRGRRLLTAGGVVLLAAAIAAVVTALGAGGHTTVRVAPNTLAAIDVGSNHVVGEVPVGAGPGPLVYAAGSLWVGNLDDRTISRVDPSTLRTLRTLPVGETPTAIAAAGGRIWVVGPDRSTTSIALRPIDPQFNAVARPLRIPYLVPGTAGSLAARDGTLWVAPATGDLVRVDPRTGRVSAPLNPNAAPAAIDADADAAWVTDRDAGTVTRVDPSGLTTAIPVGRYPAGITLGAGGLWVSVQGDDSVLRIDPASGAVTATIHVGRAPAGVTIGAGSVWVADRGDGTVTRIDPHNNRVTATIHVGGSPQQVALAGRRAWVSVGEPELPAAAGNAGGTLRIVDTAQDAAAGDLAGEDPALAYYSGSWELLYATCAKLLNYPDRAGAAGAQLVPEVAQSLPAVSDGGRRYVFTIRSGFRFSPPSNAPVTAQTFKDVLERALNPRMRSPVAQEFDDIVGARAYIAGKAAHISGVAARADKLTIELVAPAPDLLTRLAEPAMCAVPSGTPVERQGVRLIPSAGPYMTASYTPDDGVVLTRNPNYHGSRPRRLARIEYRVGVPAPRAIREVEAGSADYAVDGAVARDDAPRLATRYGPGSPAAKGNHQQYFVNPLPVLTFLVLNTHRSLFADIRLRRAVNFAIDRRALARVGDEGIPLPEKPTDDYLPPGIAGAGGARGSYPLVPDLPQARRLARGRAGRTAVLYTCNRHPCDQQAQVIRTALRALGIHLDVRTFPDEVLYSRYARRGEPFDIATAGWGPDYPDPDAMLNFLLDSGIAFPTLDDAAYRAKLAAAARVSGTRRYIGYARLDGDLVRNAAPLVAYGNPAAHELFSARIGCQVYNPVYGFDLAALCLKRAR